MGSRLNRRNDNREKTNARCGFVVRATVSDASRRQAFDAWYSREHLPDAVKSFGAEKAWRYWSFSEPSLHQAMYQFSDKAALERAINSEDMKRLIADFNRDWPDVTRTQRARTIVGVSVNSKKALRDADGLTPKQMLHASPT